MKWCLSVIVLGLAFCAGLALSRDRPVDCSLPQNCLVGKALFYGTWRREQE